MSVAILPDVKNPRTSKSSAAIDVANISHSYGERAALRGVTFQVNRAEIFGLLGPNGSGKTSLFRILSTLMLPSGGDATIAASSVRRDPAAVRRKIGVVFQSPSVDIKLTAAENLTHQGRLYGLRGGILRKRVGEMLERVGLEDRANELVETFSGGMQRRVELAKGLLHRPEVLLLDEPTTGLDPGARVDLWNYLKVLRHSEGVTVLVTTHLMEEAEKCDRLLILNEGSIVGLGTPAELRAQIGGDIVELEAADPAALARKIEGRFATSAQVIGSRVRVEIANGHRFAAEIVDAFRSDIHSVNISRPSLEDVFITRTGHRFWTDGKREEESR
ncbi:MAG TPA: ATP-binding cassette domain-containing protein [Terriglobales bacterium]|nr:ATP-binding cassette domain-containing protein [Terriglobales bacterium]